MELVKYMTTQSNVFVVVDGAAFGGFVSQVMNIINLNNHILLFAPESFEYLLLQMNQIKRKLSDEIDNTCQYCDISKHLTWEQYYTELLQNICYEEFGFSYSKSQLHESFLKKDIMDQVKSNLYLNLVKETNK